MAPRMDPPNGDWADSLSVLYQLSAFSIKSSNSSEEETEESDSEDWTTDSAEGVDEAAENAEGVAPAADAAGTAQAEHADAVPTAVDSSSIAKLCKLLWDASHKPTIQSNQPGAAPLPANTQYLIYLADNKQLIHHLAAAATTALGALCRTAPFPAAAAAAAAVESGEYKPPRAPADRKLGPRGSAGPKAESSSTAPAAEIAASTVEHLTKGSMLQAVLLLTTFAGCVRCYNSHADQQNDFMALFATKIMMLAQIEQTGLLYVMKPLCLELAATLKLQQQQQQGRSDTVQCTKLLASACLHVIRSCLIIDRPAQIYWDAVLGPIVHPAVVLAAARLDAVDGSPEDTAAAAAAARTGLAAAAAVVTLDDWVDLWRGRCAVGHEAVALADYLANSLCDAYGYKGEDTVLVKLLATPEMQKLLLVAVASRAQHLHKLAGGRAAAAAEARGNSSGHQQRSSDTAQPQQQQQQQGYVEVPAWHEKLYTACGLQPGIDLTAQYVLWRDTDPGLAVMNILTLILQLNMPEFWHQHMGALSRTVGMVRVRHELQQHLQQQQRRRKQRRQQQRQRVKALDEPVPFLLDPALRLGLLLVLLESLAVAPCMKLGVVGLKLASQLAVKGWCCDADAAFDAVTATVVASGPTGLAGREACLAMQPAASNTGSLVSPVLHILAPAYLHILDSFDPQAEQDVQPEDVATFQAMFAAMVGAVLAADLLTCGRELEAAFQTSLAAVGTALEAAVRAGAFAYGHLLTVDSPSLLIKTLRTLYGATSATRSPPVHLPTTSPATSASAAGGLQLFGLLLSSLKFTAHHVAKGTGPAEGPLELLLFSVDTLDLLLAMSEGNEGGSTAVAHRWLVLAGRCLIHCSQATKELLTAAGAGALTLGALGTAPLDQGCLGHYLQTITNGTSWLGASLDRLDAPAIDPAAAAAVASLAVQVRDQLVSEVLTNVDHAKLTALLSQQQLLAELKRVLPVSLLDQLGELGAALCGLLPLPCCCNNPGCSSLAGVSEVLAVKAGRCSGCKVAHYDCARCQKQHWDRHKAACKRLKGQPEAVQACREAA